MYSNVKAELARLGMTNAKLAEMLGIPASGVSERLNGTIGWKKDEIDKIIELTNCTYEYLFLKPQFAKNEMSEG